MMEGDETELARLADQVREWRRPIYMAAASPFRLCFRLEEPGAEDPWYVRFLLQAADDPSLLVPVPDAWKARGRNAAALTP